MGNAFHGRGLTAKQADTLGNVTACAYGGNLKSKTDADGYTYNCLDLVIFINYNDAKKVSYRHNATDDLIAMEDWVGETTFEVDLLHQLAVVMDLSGGWRGGRGCGYRQTPAESAADPREAANAAEDAAIAAAAAEAEKAEKSAASDDEAEAKVANPPMLLYVKYKRARDYKVAFFGTSAISYFDAMGGPPSTEYMLKF